MAQAAGLLILSCSWLPRPARIRLGVKCFNEHPHWGSSHMPTQIYIHLNSGNIVEMVTAMISARNFTPRGYILEFILKNTYKFHL